MNVKLAQLLMKAVFQTTKGWRKFLDYTPTIALLGVLGSLVFRQWDKAILFMTMMLAASAYQLSLKSFKRTTEMQDWMKKWGFGD